MRVIKRKSLRVRKTSILLVYHTRIDAILERKSAIRNEVCSRFLRFYSLFSHFIPRKHISIPTRTAIFTVDYAILEFRRLVKTSQKFQISG